MRELASSNDILKSLHRKKINMDILICPDSFKGTLTASEVCDLIESAIMEQRPDCHITKLPVADGGEGLCDALHSFLGGKIVSAKTRNPFNKDMIADYLILDGQIAVIEMASCAGLPLAGKHPNPLYTTTYGVGLMIMDAAKRGCKKILLGLGGSATNDCGIGMAKALGFDFLDSEGNSVEPIGKNLISVEKIVLPKESLNIKITAASDVTNPLYGENGAAYVFAPQKGASKANVKELDNGLRHISKIIERDLNVDLNTVGAGAAGGLGAGAIAFLDAEIKSGIDVVLDVLDFNNKLKNCDAVITGEGKFDLQSSQGKVISGVAKRAALMNKPVFALCGCMDTNADYKELGFQKICVSSQTTKTIEEIRKTVNNDVKVAANKLFKEILDFFAKNS